jgi:hypothetical protein
MKKLILFILLLISSIPLLSQKDSTNIALISGRKITSAEAVPVNLSIYPVPVTENSFTIKSDRDISIVRVTNIIGQDIYRIQYKNPTQLIKIPLENPKRGMYVVSIIFNDGARAVKKIMVEESK